MVVGENDYMIIKWTLYLYILQLLFIESCVASFIGHSSTSLGTVVHGSLTWPIHLVYWTYVHVVALIDQLSAE